MSKPLRVCIVVNELLRGGAQRIVSDLACGVDKENILITVVYLKSHANFAADAATVERELHTAGVRVVSIAGGRHFSFAEFVRLVVFLRRERFDIVHTYLPYAGILGRCAARLARVPHILSTQCNVRVAYDFKGYWLDRLTLPLAHAWTAAAEGIELEYGGSVSVFSEQVWKQGRRHVTVVAGVDLPVFDARIAAVHTDTKRMEVGIPVDVPLVMMVARLIPWKGPLDLVAAMRYLSPTVHLALVGWGPLKDELFALAQHEGYVDRIHLLGARSDVPELLKTADVYVQAHNRSPSGEIWKGPNTSQMEACAAGIPSVSTAVPLIESLIENEKTGILARYNDPKDLARAIQYLLDNPETAAVYAHAARTRVEDYFSVAAMIRAYSALYAAMLG
jgi:glycosyltransferase involved in cell wall biosynthesis